MFYELRVAYHWWYHTCTFQRHTNSWSQNAGCNAFVFRGTALRVSKKKKKANNLLISLSLACSLTSYQITYGKGCTSLKVAHAICSEMGVKGLQKDVSSVLVFLLNTNTISLILKAYGYPGIKPEWPLWHFDNVYNSRSGIKTKVFQALFFFSPPVKWNPWSQGSDHDRNLARTLVATEAKN